MTQSPAVFYLDRHGPSSQLASPLYPSKLQSLDRIALDENGPLFLSSEPIHDTSLLTKYQSAFKSLLQYHVKQEDIILSNKKRRRQSAGIEEMLKGLNEIVSTPLKVRMSIGDKSELHALTGISVSSPSHDGQTFVTIIETPLIPPPIPSPHVNKAEPARNKSPYKSSPFKLTPTRHVRNLTSSSQKKTFLQSRGGSPHPKTTALTSTDSRWDTSSSTKAQYKKPTPSPRKPTQSPSRTRGSIPRFRSTPQPSPTSTIVPTSHREVELQARTHPTKKDPLTIYFSMVSTPVAGASTVKPLPLMMASPSDLRLLQDIALGVENLLNSPPAHKSTPLYAPIASCSDDNVPTIPIVCPPAPPLPPPVRMPTTPTHTHTLGMAPVPVLGAVGSPSPNPRRAPRASLSAPRHSPPARQTTVSTPRSRIYTGNVKTPQTSGRKLRTLMSDTDDLLSEIESALRK